MNTPKGYDEMLGMMADFASNYIDPAWKKLQAGEKLERPTDGQFEEVFYGFNEISSALDALMLTEELLRLAPPRSKRIDKEHYLKFLIGSYLQELYILEQRLSAYAKKISRLYRKPSLPKAVQQMVYEPLKGIINTRGAHVHQRRFTDESLTMVSALALFRRVGHQFGENLEFEYKLAQSQWSKRVKENNQATLELVNRFCTLLKAVMCNDGKIVLPG